MCAVHSECSLHIVWSMHIAPEGEAMVRCRETTGGPVVPRGAVALRLAWAARPVGPADRWDAEARPVSGGGEDGRK